MVKKKPKRFEENNQTAKFQQADPFLFILFVFNRTIPAFTPSAATLNCAIIIKCLLVAG